MGFSQSHLAYLVGVTPSYIAQIEHGHRVPSLLVFQKISLVLGVTMDFLVGQSDKKNEFE